MGGMTFVWVGWDDVCLGWVDDVCLVGWDDVLFWVGWDDVCLVGWDDVLFWVGCERTATARAGTRPDQWKISKSRRIALLRGAASRRGWCSSRCGRAVRRGCPAPLCVR